MRGAQAVTCAAIQLRQFVSQYANATTLRDGDATQYAQQAALAATTGAVQKHRFASGNFQP